MPRRSILSAFERDSLLAIPDARDELIRHYTFNDTDLAVIRQRRGPTNRLGFAVQLCYLRFPGVMLGVEDEPFVPLLRMVATQLKVLPQMWAGYGRREQTRREHLVELQSVFGFQTFTTRHYRPTVHALAELALQTDKGIVLATALVENLRRQRILLPSLNVIERICAEAITRANRRIHTALADSLSAEHRQRLDDLLKRKDGSKTTWLAWLRQSPTKPNSRHMLEHIERLKVWQALESAGRHRAAGSPEPPAQDRPRGRADDARRPGQVRADSPLCHPGGTGHRRHGHRDRRNDRPARPHHGQAVQRGEEQTSAAVPGFGQGHQRQGAPVWANRPGPARRQAKRRRSVRGHRDRSCRGRASPPASARRSSSPNPKTFDFLHRVGEQLRHAAPLRAAVSGRARAARRAGRPRRAGCHRRAARDERRQRPQACPPMRRPPSSSQRWQSWCSPTTESTGATTSCARCRS